MDVSRAIVAAAAARYAALDARVAHIRALPFEDASIDAVVSNSTLDHFDEAAEIDRSVLELARVLRAGGMLVLTLDNPANPLVGRAAPDRGRDRPADPGRWPLSARARRAGTAGRAPTRFITGHFVALRATRLA